MKPKFPLKFQMVLFDGFDLLDVVAPLEVLTAGLDATPGSLSVELVTAEGPRSVRAGLTGVELAATGWIDASTADVIVVPGAAGPVEGDGPESVPTLLAAAANSSLAEQLRTAVERTDVVVATVCGGALVLAMAGLIVGRHAVTHHLGMDLLDATGVLMVKARVVDDGDLISAGAVTSGLDLGLYLLERFVGPNTAIAVERLFDYERRGTVWCATGRAVAA